MIFETQFLLALAITVAAETAVIAAMLRLVPAMRKFNVPIPRIIGAGVVPSVATLPYFWLVLPAFVTSYHLRVLLGETTIFAVETVLLRLLINLPLRYCALLSFLANGASILAGLAVFR
jgi:hypothetical protein